MKKITMVAILIVMLISCICVSFAENVALSKPVVASGEQIGAASENQYNPKEFINDGDPTTRWCSGPHGTPYVIIDLEEIYEISEVVLSWEYSLAYAYSIEVSSDGTAFQAVYAQNNTSMEAGIQRIAFSDKPKGRFVRVRSTHNRTQWGISLYELEVHGTKAENQSASADAFVKKIEKLPEAGERLTVTLDGVWQAAKTGYARNNPLHTVFESTIPVPGTWEQAEYGFGDYGGAALWVRSYVYLPEKPTGRVVLRVARAQYGRTIYVNGKNFGRYDYNFTNSYTDITDVLQAGENEIVIHLGNRDSTKGEGDYVGHTGWDPERYTYWPGITDTVQLLFHNTPSVRALQVAPNIYDATVKAKISLKNLTDAEVTSPVTVTISELGRFIQGEPTQKEKVVFKEEIGTFTVAAGGDLDITDTFAIADFCEEKLWSTNSPYLYKLEIKTAGDTHAIRFGMRDFHFDPETKLPMLNGKVHYLRGTTVAINRFMTEDPGKGSYLWKREWVKEFYEELKETNWDCFRLHLGTAPDIWYELADEMGFLIQEEYAWWGCNDEGCTTETMAPELRAWIEERGFHPCLAIFDTQNEVYYDPQTTSYMLAVRDYDIQDRPWDNGWSLPVRDTDTCECHPYLFLNNDFRISKLNTLENKAYKDSYMSVWENDNQNPKILNEYGWLWMDRNGQPAGLTGSYYNQWMPNTTGDQKYRFYAEMVSQMTEFWRVGRAHVGIMQFAALLYSRYDGTVGNTGDILMRDLSHPQIRPYIKECFKNSFAPLGIVIRDWSEYVGRGENRVVPVALVNDFNEDINDLEVTLTLMLGNLTISEETKLFSVREAGVEGDVVTQNFNVQVPDWDNGPYTLIASYTRNGETVKSVRTWKLNSGQDENICYKKPVVGASQETDDCKKEYATDGSAATRWSSYIPGTDVPTAWITIDLLRPYTLRSVDIMWEAAYATSYEIHGSYDNVNFYPMYSTTSGRGGTEICRFNANARYIKLVCKTRALPQYGYSVYQIFAHGDPVDFSMSPISNVKLSVAENTKDSLRLSASGNDVYSYTAVLLKDGIPVKTVKTTGGEFAFENLPKGKYFAYASGTNNISTVYSKPIAITVSENGLTYSEWNENTVTVEAVQDLSGKKVVIASYENNMMTKIAFAEDLTATAQKTLEAAANADQVRVFIWDSVNGLVPTGEAEILTAE